jgi:hypothetical protein
MVQHHCFYFLAVNMLKKIDKRRLAVFDPIPPKFPDLVIINNGCQTPVMVGMSMRETDHVNPGNSFVKKERDDHIFSNVKIGGPSPIDQDVLPPWKLHKQ